MQRRLARDEWRRIAMQPEVEATRVDRGLARSDDGVTWRRDGELSVMSQRDFPVLGEAWDAALIAREDALDYYLEIGIGRGDTPSTDVYLATAPLP